MKPKELRAFTAKLPKGLDIWQIVVTRDYVIVQAWTEDRRALVATMYALDGSVLKRLPG